MREYVKLARDFLTRAASENREESQEVQESNLKYFDQMVQNQGGLLDSIRQDQLSGLLPFGNTALKRLLRNFPNAFGLSVICSFAPNGYIREAAVENLSHIGEQSLPYLLLRSCDWVEPIRVMARTGAIALIPVATDGTLAKCVRVMPVLDQAKSDLFPVISAEISARKGFLRSMRHSFPSIVQEFLLKHRIIGQDETLLEIVRSGLKRPEPNIVEAVLKLIPNLSIEDKQEIFDTLKTVKRPSARLQVIEFAEVLEKQEVLRELIADPNWRTRNNARFALKNLGFDSFTDHYRSRLPAPAAIAGFGEIALEGEITELLPLLSHPLPRVRYEVILAIKNRDHRDSVAIIEPYLEDESPRVVRITIQALSHFGFRFKRQELERLIRNAKTPKLRRVLEGAFAFLPRWESLETALDLITEGHLSPGLGLAYYWWSVRARYDYTGPSREQLHRVTVSLERARTGLPEFTVAAIEVELKYWSSRQANF